jgi:Glycosyl hydrolase family 63 C-terminal domain
VFVEYAKAEPEDLLVRIIVHNRGAEAARLHVLPTLWFRNTWSWGVDDRKPSLRATGAGSIEASHHELGTYALHCDGSPELLFTENESNAQRLWGQPNRSPYVKDAFHPYVISGQRDAVNPAKEGTKAAARYLLDVPGGSSRTVRVRLSASTRPPGFRDFDEVFTNRIADADEFFTRITPRALAADARLVHRQALAGMLWGKQYYYFDLEQWLSEHRSHPLIDSARHGVRNTEWFHMLNADIISMPDKWEYPWYAAWDLAFHTTSLALVDFDFAKEQLLLMLRNFYFHPNGQIPAYEWNFSDVNPPVHAWATLYLFRMEQTLGRADMRFLERSFQGLMLNFNWWVNRKDPAGRNVFAGGFLGLDNIGVFDRSAELPTGGSLEQADGTAWMAFYCQCMLEMALILSDYDRMYEEIAFKFVQHFMWISYAMDRIGENQDEMWDEEDGFFYDLLRLPNGQSMRLKVRSMVGLLPLCASTVFEEDAATRYPKLMEMIAVFRKRHPELVSHVAPTDEGFVGYKGRRLLSILNQKKLQRVLRYLLDENEFLGPYGIRSLSKYHQDHPFKFWVGHQEFLVQYLPAESNTGMFGGNSNWRGPVWMPVNALIVRGLLNLYGFYGNDFTVECPTGSGRQMNLYEVAEEITRRLAGTFRRDAGRRPVYGGSERFQNDPHWRDLILFYEYFHGDNGAGLGASHQTGWTGLVGPLVDLFGRIDAKSLLESERTLLHARVVREQVGGETVTVSR